MIEQNSEEYTTNPAEPKKELPSTLMEGDFTVDEIVAAIKRVGAGKQLATSLNVATELRSGSTAATATKPH